MKPTIVIQEDGMFVNVPMQVPELTDYMCSALTGAVLQVINNINNSPDATDEIKSQVKDELFDAMNIAFSKCLENSFPEMELRPDITAETIKELEDSKVINFKPKDEPHEDTCPVEIEPECPCDAEPPDEVEQEESK